MNSIVNKYDEIIYKQSTYQTLLFSVWPQVECKLTYNNSVVFRGYNRGTHYKAELTVCLEIHWVETMIQ